MPIQGPCAPLSRTSGPRCMRPSDCLCLRSPGRRPLCHIATRTARAAHKNATIPAVSRPYRRHWGMGGSRLCARTMTDAIADQRAASVSECGATESPKGKGRCGAWSSYGTEITVRPSSARTTWSWSSVRPCELSIMTSAIPLADPVGQPGTTAACTRGRTLAEVGVAAVDANGRSMLGWPA